ncbi:MAG: hypothetical protein DWQ07_00230 [Chloroflexi bacterium]|nr:MAG: hypothetical protein DWQ07_00230 [Chloroflexota bacterium]MBL1196011.1 hypothetical protein [Chloroflexota bacterium]NOH13305.1 hypothetical protein [Chloroflexota bacterium]
MNNSHNTHDETNNAIRREDIIALLDTALRSSENKFARRVSAVWLNTYPGDMQVDFLHARALLADGHNESALSTLKKLVNSDPEFQEAQEELTRASEQHKYSSAETARASVVALGGEVLSVGDVPEWGYLLAKAREELQKEDVRKAETLVQNALLADPPTPLPAVTHLLLASKHYDWMAVRKLAELYSQRWPDALAVTLILADLLMDSGEEDDAVALLHQCAAHDVGGQVVKRLWGAQHRFTKMWPQEMKVWLDIPIPAAVTAALGWNRLAEGALEDNEAKSVQQDALAEEAIETLEVYSQEKSAVVDEDATPEQDLPTVPKKERKPLSKEVQETLLNVQAELDRVAERIKEPGGSSKADGRFPVYVLVTTQQGLEAQYGLENVPPIEEALLKVVSETQKWQHWGAMLFYADDPENIWKYGFEPAKHTDPWSIKHSIADLDEALRARGEMIGAMLIVGGPQVVPFHNLPNPVDDDDNDVPSDNPYATTDDNYFIPHWPIGRLPGGGKSDPKVLLHNLHLITRQRQKANEPRVGARSLWQRILDILLRRRFKASFGYTAEIWRRASNSVFRPIGEPAELVVSPPSQTGRLPKDSQRPVDLSYYNLHGLIDTAEWYGQRDPIETPSGPDYPVALSPKDVKNSGRAPQVVFSEACYGAHIHNKTVDSALALKFLASGSQAVIGSTMTSYGSIATPLIAADLLGQAFWKYLQDGHTTGEALRRAKIYLARQMHRRQGYLDGEDQKTLISFILYGDPLAQPLPNGKGSKSIQRSQQAPSVKTICDRSDGPEGMPVPNEVLYSVKKIVKSYLPGMENAAVSYTQEHVECDGHECPTTQLGAKSHPEGHPQRRLVTLSKHIPGEGTRHPRYARITLNKEGKVVKMAVSR